MLPPPHPHPHPEEVVPEVVAAVDVAAAGAAAEVPEGPIEPVAMEVPPEMTVPTILNP